MSSQTVPSEEWNEMKTGMLGRMKMFVGTLEKTGMKWFADTKTVSGGSAVFYLTDDGTPDGVARFSTIHGCIFQMGASDRLLQEGEYVISNSNRTVTVSVRQVTSVLLGLIEFSNEGNGRQVKILAYGE